MIGSRKRLPPLNTIAAFEASARLMSFTAAATELNLTQGAVSRQIQRLEERLDAPLFDRKHKKIVLTNAGEIFYHAICESLVSIKRAVIEIERLNNTQVTIAASLAMSSFWVMPALLKLKNELPEINVSILASDSVADPLSGFVDLAIRYGDGNWPGLRATKLFDEKIFPVCSKAYELNNRIDSIEKILQCRLIEVMSENSICGSWEEWLSRFGYPNRIDKSQLLLVSNFDLAYRAAEAGEGIALAWNYGPQEMLKSQRLVRPIGEFVATGLAEYLVERLAPRNDHTVERIRKILISFSESDGSAIF